MRAKIREIRKFRNQRQIFADRTEAGETLAWMLQSKIDHIAESMILAIPSGGVPVGIQMQKIPGYLSR